MTPEVANLDLNGDDNMEKVVTIKIYKTGETIQLRPDGRTCKTCPFKDNDFDPVTIACMKKRSYMAWGKPPRPDGTSVGDS